MRISVQYLQVITARRYIISFSRSLLSVLYSLVPHHRIAAASPHRLWPMIGCPGWAPPTRLHPSWLSLWWLAFTPYNCTALRKQVIVKNREHPLTLKLPSRTAEISPIIRTTSSYLYVLSVSHAASRIVIISRPRYLQPTHYWLLQLTSCYIRVGTGHDCQKCRHPLHYQPATTFIHH